MRHCRICAGKTWDVFYVVTDDVNEVVKFGITSGNPRLRLSHHERDGLDQIVRLIEGYPEARKLENTCITAMRDVGEKPLRGREYFHIRALGTILDLVDGWTFPACPSRAGQAEVSGPGLTSDTTGVKGDPPRDAPTVRDTYLADSQYRLAEVSRERGLAADRRHLDAT
ncbi:hypothetical protein OG462_41990 [Streptomyces sp. NBC_01077]|uniref:hypothetical protein n=1 Tax=Streptomyces sp. NBC_01077 TaxID=2903746 RepID=UPI003865610F|nr:hypothetical protein OG462_03030 [Streptomyces sp. NBC_01077]WSV43446.1 hypothetical protein OG462_41990 [Streptomyces sp. NBC_01077]